MNIVLSEIDALTRPLHYYLTGNERCFFLREYTSNRGYSHSGTNSLILNLKKGVDRRGTDEWKFKQRAIAQAARELRTSLNPQWLERATLVPIPPSKAPSDPLYDDRMLQVLRNMDTASNFNIRDILSQKQSVTATHRTTATRDPAAIAENYNVDPSLISPRPPTVGLFDDVLTTGAHFIAASQVLAKVWPTVPIFGIFIARRILPEPNESPFDR